LIAGRYNDEQILMFGEIVGLLASGNEASARAVIDSRLVRSIAHGMAKNFEH
jgi:hypothetical protein